MSFVGCSRKMRRLAQSGAVCCDRRRDSIEGWASLWGACCWGMSTAWAHVGQMWGLCLRRAFLVGAGAQVRGGGAHDVFLNVVHGFARKPLPARRERRCQSRSPLRTLSGRGTVEKGGRDRESAFLGSVEREIRSVVGACRRALVYAGWRRRERIRAFVVAVTRSPNALANAAAMLPAFHPLTAPPRIYGT
ncbi:hypothetical protein BJV77DRAFT_958625 [Russula vinacea]|nr:hypothetical protein BJV77DRAFT_958625 [Russula vinacea]